MKRFCGFRSRLSIRFAALVLVSIAHFSIPATATAQSENQARSARNSFVTLLGIPSATVAPQGVTFGSIFSAFGLSSGEQQALSFGHGFGNVDRGLGFQISATVGSASGSYDDYGYLGLKASRRIASGQNPTYLGISADRIGGWGEISDVDPAFSLTVTHFSRMGGGAAGDGFPVMFSLGAGNSVGNQDNSGGGFIGMGIGLTDSFATSAAWNGDNVTLGTSFRSPSLKNVVFSAMLEDAFDQDDRQRISLTVSFYGRDLFRR